MLTDHTALLVHLPPDPAMGYHGFVACETVVEGSVMLRRFSAAFCMGTAPGLGQQLGGAGTWEGAEKRPCRQVGVSPALISALASRQLHLLSPSPWAEAISVHNGSKLKRVQLVWTPLPNPRDPSFWVLELK